MSEQAALLGIPHAFEFEGRTLKVAPCDFEIEALYTVWLEYNARLKINTHSGNLGPHEYALALERWDAACASEQYAWDSLASFRSRFSAAGMKQLALLQLQKGTGERAVSMDTVERLYADDPKWKEYQAVKARADADPSRPVPWASKAAG